MGVIVFPVLSGARPANGLGALVQVAQQVMVQELRPVVGIEAEDAKSQMTFDILDLLRHSWPD